MLAVPSLSCLRSIAVRPVRARAMPTCQLYASAARRVRAQKRGEKAGGRAVNFRLHSGKGAVSSGGARTATSRGHRSSTFARRRQRRTHRVLSDHRTDPPPRRALARAPWQPPAAGRSCKSQRRPLGVRLVACRHACGAESGPLVVYVESSLLPLCARIPRLSCCFAGC